MPGAAVGAVLAGTARLIHQVVEKAENVRSLVDQIEIELTVKTTERLIGQLQDIDIANGRLGNDFAQGQLNGLSRSKMTGADGCGQDKNTRFLAHVRAFHQPEQAGRSSIRACREDVGPFILKKHGDCYDELLLTLIGPTFLVSGGRKPPDASRKSGGLRPPLTKKVEPLSSRAGLPS